MPPVIEINNLTKTYQMGDVQVHALQGVDFQIEEGEFVAIMGVSGSGKSTLLNLIGCLDQASSGKYFLKNKAITSLHEQEFADIRNQKIGFIFQGFNLIPRTTVYENVELPLLYDRNGRIENPEQAIVEAIRNVGLQDRMNHMPQQLSGGEQQRVAIARALVNKPSIILADEPTGNLDSKTSIDIIAILQRLNDEGITIILVTHEQQLANYTKRILHMEDGKIIRDFKVQKQLRA